MNVVNPVMKTEQLGHLGLVAATIHQLGIIDKINQRLPLQKDKGGKISHGHRCCAMLLNGLGYTTRTLYLSSHFFEDKPLARLLGIEVDVDALNDDMLGRHLDAIARYGTTQLFSEIAFEICQEQGLFGKSCHLDTTTLTLYGDYEGYPQISPIPALGYSKDHRPDLKQVTLSLTQTCEGNIPLWMEALAGNSSDKISFQETVDRITRFQKALADAPAQLFVMDAAFYTLESIARLSHVKWLTRVPANHKVAQALLEQPQMNLTWQTINANYAISAHHSQYGGIEQRWLLVASTAAKARELTTFYKRLDKQYEKLDKALWHLSHQVFSCESDAKRAIMTLVRTFKYHRVDYQIVPIMKHHGKGRPALDAIAVCIGYQCHAHIASNIQTIRTAIDCLGRFILATNELDKTKLCDEELLSEYKAQTHIEAGFGFLKSDEFELNHIFLKNPTRIGALMMVMTLCLVVYNFAQYRLRKTLAQSEHVLPNQLGKPIKEPTLRWVFQLMSKISVVCLRDDTSQPWRSTVCNLKTLQILIVMLFGQHARQIYDIPISDCFPLYDKNKKNLLAWCGM